MVLSFKMKKFINRKALYYFRMKLNKNEKFTLTLMLKNPNISNTEIANELKITTQAVGKIKKQLISKGFIKEKELVLDYDKLGIKIFTIALIKIMPKAFNKFKAKELDNLLQPVNVINSYAIPQTNVTHIIIYAFRNIEEYENYFKTLQTKLGDLMEIRETYVVSPKSILKSSSKELFLKILEEYGKEKEMPEPEITELAEA